MQIGTKIKQLRELRNYTQAYMAHSLQMSLNGYGRLERDEVDMTLQRLERIAKLLGVDLLQILCFDENRVFNGSLSDPFMAHLQQENLELRSQVNRLLGLLEKQVQSVH